MKYFVKFEDAIILKGGKGRIFSVRKIDKEIDIQEECDACFGEKYTKKDFIEMIEELKEWIES